MAGMTFHCALLLLSVHLMGAVAQNCSSPASQVLPSATNINIFDHLVASDPDVAAAQLHAPWIQGADENSPAYEFAGIGSGFTVTTLSEAIREASCTHNEVTFTGHVFVKKSESDGPLIELSYAGGLENGLVVYLLHMDGAADEFVLAYRHQGHLHSESIPVRLLSGRWRDYAIRLSGNLLSFYFDCELLEERIVPLPDYCANDSSVVVNVATSIHDSMEYSGQTGLYIYAQNLGIHFGPGGIQRQCPNAPEICPTCGQFFSLLERLTEARDKLTKLQDKVQELEEESSFACPPSPTPPVDLAPNDCLVMVNSQPRIFLNDDFLLLPNRVCFCDNGRPVCTNLDRTNINNPTPVSCPESPSSQTPPPSNDDPQQPEGGICDVIALGITIREGEFASVRLDNNQQRCRVFSCEDIGFGLGTVPREVQCINYAEENCTSYEGFGREAATCCRKCDDCHFTTCPENTRCVLQDSPSSSATCICKDGFHSPTEGAACEDINECRIGGPQGHNCPDNSRCINTEGSFQCSCFMGYSEVVDNLGSFTCEDNDECADNTHNCAGNSRCENTKGSFECPCLEGYEKTAEDPTCRPVCNPPCENGGVCTDPDVCTCLPEFTGAQCEDDINECNITSLNTCLGTKKLCINTFGGHFCRCEKGYQEDENGECRDVDECDLPIHNCHNSATCQNTMGSFKCLCAGENTPVTDCTGSCLRRGEIYLEGESYIDNCRNCTCFGGEMTCRKIECDCNNLDQLPSAVVDDCCSVCTRKDCIIMNGDVRIRPKSTWINPSNRCERYNCLQNLTAVFVDYSSDCPVPDCPEELQTIPMGKCCPVCMLPTCEGDLEGRTLSLRNGCEHCTCQSSKWTCNEKQCPEVNCEPKDIVFNKKGCCPVCRHDVLGYSLGQSPTPTCTI